MNSLHAKRYPPYGKKLNELRRRGLMPALRVIVTTDWSLGRIFPRIVITGDTPVTNLQFHYLTGLHVQIVHFDSDEQILSDLITEILAVKPATLSAFNMDAVKQGKPAFKLIYTQSTMEAA